MTSPESLRKGLNREPLNGCFIGLFNALSSEIVAAAGYDTALIDMEHGPGSYTEASAVLQAIHCGSDGHCAGIIRTTSAASVDIKRALDIGPQGIMAPMVNSAAQAVEVVQNCHYAPRGKRSCADPVIRATGFGRNQPDYQRFMEEDFLVIVQIEHIDAVNDVENIASVDGVHMLFVGPLDLSASLGDRGNFKSAAFNDALGQIEQAANHHGKLLGTLALPDLPAEVLAARGYRLILSGFDVKHLKVGAEQDVTAMRAAFAKRQAKQKL